MSQINNKWVGYLDRSYQSIKNSVLSRVTSSNPELTDHSESNIFVIIISIFAGIGEQLNYYIDNMMREAFMGVARRRSSVIRHSYLTDYRIRTSAPESVDVVISIVDNSNNPINLSANVTIPLGTLITSSSGVPFRTTQNHTLVAGQNTYTIPFSQVTLSTDVALGNTNTLANQRFLLPANYVHNSLVLKVNSVTYDRKESWAEAEYDSKAYIVEVESNDAIKVELGDGIRGEIPAGSLAVTGTFYTTLGILGRIEPETLTTPPILSLPINTAIKVNNPLTSSGGSNIESTESIRRNAIYTRRANNRMVTADDYKRILEAVPGVARAYTHFCCGRTIDMYITPEGGGIASEYLLGQVLIEAEEKKMEGTVVVPKAAGITILFIKLKVIAKKNQNLANVSNEVASALVAYGSTVNQEINNIIRLSSIYYVVRSLDQKVLDVEIEEMYAIPYAYPKSHNVPLDWECEILEGSTENHQYVMEYVSGNIKLVRDRIFLGNVAVGDEYGDSKIKFTVNSSTYENGYKWGFKTYPYTQNIFLEDFTIATIDPDYLEIQVLRAEDRDLPC